MSSEALARLEAEARLLRKHKAEYERLLKKQGKRTEAIISLVAKYKNEYGDLVKRSRERLEAEDASAA